jgi:hypothetical protein
MTSNTLLALEKPKPIICFFLPTNPKPTEPRNAGGANNRNALFAYSKANGCERYSPTSQ